MRTANRSTLRAALAVALVSTWLVLLFAGHVAGGAIHLLFAAALAVFPWRAAVAPDGGRSSTPGAPSHETDEKESP